MVTIELNESEEDRQLFLIFVYEWWPDESELVDRVKEGIINQDKLVSTVDATSSESHDRTIIQARLQGESIDKDILDSIVVDVSGSLMKGAKLRGSFISIESVTDNKGLRQRVVNK